MYQETICVHLDVLLKLCLISASRGSGHTSVLEQRLDQLEQEREELDALLEERDGQLGAMKESVAALNAEYMADLETVRAECGGLARYNSDLRDSHDYI